MGVSWRRPPQASGSFQQPRSRRPRQWRAGSFEVAFKARDVAPAPDVRRRSQPHPRALAHLLQHTQRAAGGEILSCNVAPEDAHRRGQDDAFYEGKGLDPIGPCESSTTRSWPRHGPSERTAHARRPIRLRRGFEPAASAPARRWSRAAMSNQCERWTVEFRTVWSILAGVHRHT